MDNCNLSNTLRNASRNGVKVNLITRPPSTKTRRYYHSFLKQDGVQITYNKLAHAKLIVVDRIITVISSMNFTTGSSGEGSWEAGLVSTEETVVESVCNSILELLEKPESKDWV
jgi:phosphatidylserine/phosphatidylglycerophosphate/cardiolipin synthase-like enzyme